MGKPSYCVGFEPAELFWFRLYVEACRRGLGTALVTLVVVLGDGAKWIWDYAPQFLAVAGVKLIEIVDIYHAFEYLGDLANAVFGQGTEAAKEWVEPLKQQLAEAGAAPILAVLTALNPEDPEATDEVRKAIVYFTNNAPRMDYPRFVALNLVLSAAKDWLGGDREQLQDAGSRAREGGRDALDGDRSAGRGEPASAA